MESKLQEPSALKKNIHPLEIYFFPSIFGGHFCPPGFGSSRPEQCGSTEKLQESKNTKTMAKLQKLYGTGYVSLLL
jgi:hypothetical protein